MKYWIESTEKFMPTLTWVDLQKYYFPKQARISPIKASRAYLLIANCKVED